MVAINLIRPLSDLPAMSYLKVANFDEIIVSRSDLSAVMMYSSKAKLN